jgi:hypothetical protein
MTPPCVQRKQRTITIGTQPAAPRPCPCLTCRHMPDMQVAFEQHPNAHFNSYDPIYTAAHQFEEQLYADWSVRTEDPWEANMFYVPALVLAAACKECSCPLWLALAGGKPLSGDAHADTPDARLSLGRGCCVQACTSNHSAT